MKKKIYNQNQATLTGTIISLPRVYKRMGDAVTYQIRLKVNRPRGYHDVIPVLISHTLLELMPSEYENKTVTIAGYYRSTPYNERDKYSVPQFVFAKSITIVDDETKHANRVHATGFICKEPVLKKTPSGKEITEVLLAINTATESYYAPCVFGGNNSKAASELNIGDCIEVECRAHSRLYQKVIADGFEQRMTAYELSVYKYKVLYQNKKKKTEEPA